MYLVFLLLTTNVWGKKRFSFSQEMGTGSLVQLLAKLKSKFILLT
jgi:hypothetical protein